MQRNQITAFEALSIFEFRKTQKFIFFTISTSPNWHSFTNFAQLDFESGYTLFALITLSLSLSVSKLEKCVRENEGEGERAKEAVGLLLKDCDGRHSKERASVCAGSSSLRERERGRERERQNKSEMH